MSVSTQALRVRGGSTARWRSWMVTAAVVGTLSTGFAVGRLSAPDAAAVRAPRPLVHAALVQDRPGIRPGSDRGTVKVQPAVDAIHRVEIRAGGNRGTAKRG
jgi:hypothetical protein